MLNKQYPEVDISHSEAATHFPLLPILLQCIYIYIYIYIYIHMHIQQICKCIVQYTHINGWMETYIYIYIIYAYTRTFIRKARGSVVVKVLYYEPQVLGFETDKINIFFNLPNPSGHTRSWGLLRIRKIMFLLGIERCRCVGMTTLRHL
jgi:hypothetical protein